jgi:hypothetical protein
VKWLSVREQQVKQICEETQRYLFNHLWTLVLKFLRLPQAHPRYQRLHVSGPSLTPSIPEPHTNLYQVALAALSQRMQALSLSAASAYMSVSSSPSSNAG